MHEDIIFACITCILSMFLLVSYIYYDVLDRYFKFAMKSYNNISISYLKMMGGGVRA